MDRALANAHKRRSELRRELELVESFISLYERFAEDVSSNQASLPLARTPVFAPPVAVQTESEGASDAELHRDLKPANRPSRGLSREELRPLIAEELKAAGKPLTRGQILRRLDAKGIPVGGEADRAKNMGTILWRLKDSFVNLPNLGYWLKDQAYPPAEYDPDDLNSPDFIQRTLAE